MSKTLYCNDFYRTYSNIMRAPSVLIAGTPGSGKSVLLNGLIYNTIAEFAPEDCTIYFIDPKRVELAKFARLPHCAGIAKTPQGACKILLNVSNEMESRYNYMEKRGIVKITNYPVFVIFTIAHHRA